ncbi:MAG: hypothetical protein U5J64_08990 [Halobacteriales archaeon]|nr:hypothetical protein [Halobacteriales archaeon]
MIVLSGVAADTTNAEPTPHLYEDGGFDYIPIPETAREETVETRTYADVSTRDSTAAEYLGRIYPGGGDVAVEGDALADFPVHHDPNFDALTYGERRPAYVERLRRLEEGDAVAFYTGLRNEDAEGLQRYVIGYFVVDEVVYFENFDDDEARERIREHPENAHTKRFEATGEVDDNLVVVEGREGGLLDEAFRISERTPSGHYYLRDDLQDAFSPEPSGRDDRNAYLGGIKQAHVLRVGVDGFLGTVA